MIHTRDTSAVVPTFSHFYPKFAIVIHGSKKMGLRGLKTILNLITIGLVPKMAVKYMFIYINVAILTVPKSEVKTRQIRKFCCVDLRLSIDRAAP